MEAAASKVKLASGAGDFFYLLATNKLLPPSLKNLFTISLRVEVNRSLYGFVFAEQRITLIPVSFFFFHYAESQKHRNVGRHLSEDSWFFKLICPTVQKNSLR